MEQERLDLGGSQSSQFFSYGGAALTSDRSDWESPRDIYARLDKFWKFDLDVAASDENHLCENYFTKEDDGLAQSWRGAPVLVQPTV